MDKLLKTHTLFDSIKTTIEEARNKAKQSINHIMIEAYWHIGRLIVEEEQKGSQRAAPIVQTLSAKLSWSHYLLNKNADSQHYDHHQPFKVHVTCKPIYNVREAR